MTSTAIVEKIENGIVTVVTVRKGACGDNCSMCGGCKGERVLTKAYSNIEVEVGDTVTVESDTSSVMLAMLALFVLPIALPLVALIALYSVSAVLSYVVAAVSVALSLVFVLFLSRSKVFNSKVAPKITAVIKKK